MVDEFSSRIHFVHLRQVMREADGSFYEAEHLRGSSDMVGVISAVLKEEARRRKQNRFGSARFPCVPITGTCWLMTSDER